MEKIHQQVFKYDRIVIGGGLNALLYAYLNNCPCIFTNIDPPFRFDDFDESFDFRPLGVITSSKLELWERLIRVLGLSGLLPMADKTASITINKNVLKAITHVSRLGRFQFEKLIIFDDEKVSGLPFIENRIELPAKVIDWFNVRSGMEHHLDVIHTHDHFVSRIYFYPSDRLDGAKGKRLRKDLVAVSYLEPDQLNNFDYSPTMARFKIIQLMKEAGIRGARNGRDTYNPKLYRYYSPKIESAQRERIRDIKNYYEPDERFEFRYDTPEEIIKNFPEELESYSSRLARRL
tara:strand:+ start:9 stop:881 length:873 start_codon:yes stop_codon:yes gene_type:complete